MIPITEQVVHIFSAKRREEGIDNEVTSKPRGNTAIWHVGVD